MCIGLVLFFSSSVQNLTTQDCDGPALVHPLIVVLSEHYNRADWTPTAPSGWKGILIMLCWCVSMCEEGSWGLYWIISWAEIYSFCVFVFRQSRLHGILRLFGRVYELSLHWPTFFCYMSPYQKIGGDDGYSMGPHEGGLPPPNAEKNGLRKGIDTAYDVRPTYVSVRRNSADRCQIWSTQICDQPKKLLGWAHIVGRTNSFT